MNIIDGSIRRPLLWRGGRHALLAAASIAACAISFAATPVAAGTLDETLADAYRDNPTLQAARAELRRTDELVPEALAGWRPEADVTGGGGWAFNSGGDSGTKQSNVSSASGPAIALDLRVRQPIYNFTTPANVRQAKSAVLAQRARLEAVEQDTLLRAATAYLDVLRSQATLDLAVRQQQLLQRDLDSSRRRFDAGELKNSDVALAEASVARARAQRVQTEGTLAAARATYASVTGQPPGSLELPAEPGELPTGEAAAREESAQNPTVVAADLAVRAAEDGVDVSFGSELPQVYLQADAGASAQTILGLVSFPIYHGGMMDAQVRAAKQLVMQRRQEADAQRRLAEQQAVAAWETYASARANVESFDAQVTAAQIGAEGTRREGDLGLRTTTDMLLAQQQVFEAQVDLTGARRDSLVGAYQLLAAVGKLTARDLHLDVPLYDPTRHYDEVRDKWWGRDIGEGR